MSNLYKAEKQEIMDLFVNHYIDFATESEEETEITLRHIQLIRKLAKSTNYDIKKMVEDFSDEYIYKLAKATVDYWIPFDKTDTDKYGWRFDSGNSDNPGYLVICPKTIEHYMSTLYIAIPNKQQELLLKDASQEVDGKCILDPAIVKKNHTENFDLLVKESLGDCKEILEMYFSEFIENFEQGYTDEKILQLIKEENEQYELDKNELNEPQSALIQFSATSTDVSTSEINQVVAEEDKARVTCKL